MVFFPTESRLVYGATVEFAHFIDHQVCEPLQTFGGEFAKRHQMVFVVLLRVCKTQANRGISITFCIVYSWNTY